MGQSGGHCACQYTVESTRHLRRKISMFVALSRPLVSKRLAVQQHQRSIFY